FYQAEDGIRDLIVTGVQTCARQILGETLTGEGPHRPRIRVLLIGGGPVALSEADAVDTATRLLRLRDDEQPRLKKIAAYMRGRRSEERRVGNECRRRGRGAL